MITDDGFLIAPGRRTVFLNKGTLYYNDKGQKKLDKTGFTGCCVVAKGDSVYIENGRVKTTYYLDILIRALKDYRIRNKSFTYREVFTFLRDYIHPDLPADSLYTYLISDYYLVNGVHDLNYEITEVVHHGKTYKLDKYISPQNITWYEHSNP